MTALHFDDADVRRLLSLEALLPAMRRALADLSAGRVVPTTGRWRSGTRRGGHERHRAGAEG